MEPEKWFFSKGIIITKVPKVSHVFRVSNLQLSGAKVRYFHTACLKKVLTKAFPRQGFRGVFPVKKMGQTSTPGFFFRGKVNQTSRVFFSIHWEFVEDIILFECWPWLCVNNYEHLHILGGSSNSNRPPKKSRISTHQYSLVQGTWNLHEGNAR